MPGNTKQLKKDVDQKPAPQYFDPVLDEYGYLYGSNGAARHVIYGADGEPISTTGNKLAVRATEMETILTQILAKIIATPATEAKQDSVITALGTLLTKTGFDAKADLALSALRDALRGTGNKTLTDLATAQAALAAAIGEAAAAPTANTILARLKSLEDKIDAITSGATPATAQLTGRKVIPISLLSTSTSISAGTILDLDTLVDLSNIGNNGHGVSVFIGNGANDNLLPIEVYVKYYLQAHSIGLRDRSNTYTTVYTGEGASHFFSFVPVYPKFKLSIKNTHPSVFYHIGSVIVQSGL